MRILSRPGYYIFSLLFLYYSSLTAQTVTIANGAIVAIATSTNASTTGDINIASGSTLNNHGVVELKGNWANNGSFRDVDGVVIFTSPANGKTISGSLTGVNKFNNLVFNGNGTWSFNNEAEVGGNVLLANGNVTAPSGIFTLDGNLEQTGASFFHNNGTVLFKSTAPQSYTAVTPLVFYDLTNNNISGSSGLSVNSNLSIVNKLELMPASKLNLVAGDITLLSVEDATARVATIPATATIAYSGSNRFIVQRYFPATRAWRLVTAPLSGTGSIYDNWQNGGVKVPGIGLLVTGPNPSPANGLDPSQLNNPSLKAGSSLAPVVDTKAMNLSGNNGSADNIGYFLFVRGDRDPANTIIPNTNVTTISSKGKLQTGTQTFPASNNQNNFSLIGNPYVSPVNFSAIIRTNVEKRFITWEPRINSVGGYIVGDDIDNDGIYSYSVVGPGNQDEIIQSSQAFFVQTSSNGPASVTFSESNKAAKNNLGIFRPVNPVNAPASFRINLLRTGANNNFVLADGTLAEFYDHANAAVDIKDAVKFTNINETFSLRRGTGSLAIERRPVINSDDTLFLQLTRTTNHNYLLQFVPSGLDASLVAFLEDSYNGSQTKLSVTAASSYEFAVNEDAASAVADRFRIVFKPTAVVFPGIDNGNNSITVFPNPVANGVINLQMKNQQAGKYRVRLLNRSGQIILVKKFIQTAINSTVQIEFNRALAHGLYELEITKSGGLVKNINILY